MLYSIAFIMDPRAKVRGFNKVLVLLSNLTGTDCSPYLTEVGAELSTMFNKYDDKFGAVRLQRLSQPVSSSKKKLPGVRFLVMVLVLLVLVHPVLVTLPPLHPLYLEELLPMHCYKQQQVVLLLVLLLNYLPTWTVTLPISLMMISIS